MALSVNSTANHSQQIAAVFSGNSGHYAERKKQVTDSSTLPEGQGIRVSSRAITELDEQRQQQKSVYSERFHQKAVELYQSVQHEQRRSEVQSMLGVDLYA